MNSKIKVSYDYNKKEPYIKFQLAKDSDELADGHLKHLIEQIKNHGLRLQYPERNEGNMNPEIRIGCRYFVPIAGLEIVNFLNEREIPHTQHSDCTEIDVHVDLFNLGVNFANANTQAKSAEPVNGFDEAVKPLFEYLSKNHHPHTTAIVTSTTAELVEGMRTSQNK